MRSAVIATAFATALAGSTLAAAPASAAVWMALDPAGGCGSLGCEAFTPGTYARTISAADLAGLSRISTFLLDRSLLADRPGAVFRLTFYAGDQKVGDFGKFMIDMLAGDKVLLSGAGFDYDPSWGDLQVRVEIDGGMVLKPEYAALMATGGGGGGGAFVGGGFSGTIASPLEFVQPGSDDIDTTPPPEFGFEPPLVSDVIAAVPEPASWAMMILGFGLTGLLVRARRRLETAAARVRVR
jgi:hypothetical protein